MCWCNFSPSWWCQFPWFHCLSISPILNISWFIGTTLYFTDHFCLVFCFKFFSFPKVLMLVSITSNTIWIPLLHLVVMRWNNIIQMLFALQLVPQGLGVSEYLTVKSFLHIPFSSQRFRFSPNLFGSHVGSWH